MVGGVVAAAALDPFESELHAAHSSATATAPARPERTRMRRDLRSNWLPSGVCSSSPSPDSAAEPRRSDTAVAALFTIVMFLPVPVGALRVVRWDSKAKDLGPQQ